jgi:hypothetical protein
VTKSLPTPPFRLSVMDVCLQPISNLAVHGEFIVVTHETISKIVPWLKSVTFIEPYTPKYSLV